MAHIPYGRQNVTAADIAAVTEVLRSDWLTQGPMVPRFERALADECGAQHAVAVGSATAALHIACLSLGLGPGDWIWTSPITFLASANCGRYCGAQVDFVDIDSRTYNLCPQSLARKLEAARAEQRLPKIVIPVHLAGQSCDMAAIHALSREYGFRVIEDASHAVGGRYQGQPVGGCRFSDITVFSFHPVKIITSAEGGMALTNDTALAQRMALLRSHGTTRDPAQMSRAPDGPWYYEQIELGYNYRMTDMQAALGHSQAKRLGDCVDRRHQLARRYDAGLADLPITLPWQHADCYSAFHLYIVRVDPRHRGAVFNQMRAHDIGVNVHYIPVYKQPYYERQFGPHHTLPEAEHYYREAISLPMYATLGADQQDRVVSTLRAALQGASR